MTLTFRANNFFGVPQAAVEETRHQAEYQNRGTENDMIVFSPTTSDRPVLAWDVVSARVRVGLLLPMEQLISTMKIS